MTAGQLLFRQQTPLNGVITVRQHGEFRVCPYTPVLPLGPLPDVAVQNLMHHKGGTLSLKIWLNICVINPTTCYICMDSGRDVYFVVR